ncbi:MAG: carbohydrate ABC transporter permease [Peptococcaceae bacterium]|jgi:ABC-type glycerol-3-phosphate transport system permease component|nr:carbohydrate ABC transporter permease [Peptococcaceae bacterium]
MKKKITPVKLLINIVKWAFLLAIMAFTVYPVIYAALGSVKSNFELTLGGGGVLPDKWMFSNYVTAFKANNFGRYTINSLILSAMVTALALITASMAGYVFARREFPGKRIILMTYTSMMFISLGSVTLFPLYSLLKAIGLTKNLFGMALIMTGGQIASVFLIMGFVRSIPRELDEAAYIDGCSLFKVYYMIILPTIRPILAVVLLFSFRMSWNDYITPLVMSIGTENLRTLTVAVVELKYSMQAAAEWHIMLAGASIALIPILIVYLFTHKQFIAGLTAGAVKG